MAANPRAGQPAQPEDLIDVAQVVTAYYTVEPDPDNVDQQVAFGTSGHRGSSLDAAFNEAHILATTQAIVEYRAAQGTTGPLFIGRDTHALSEPAWASALEVLAANDVVAMIDSADRYTPTPAVSHAILTFNRGRDGDLADGIVVTPSHNPPRDGGFKYNPPNGGPADTDATGVIAKRANEILRDGLKDVKRVPLARALQTAQRHDYMDAYIEDLPNVVDVHAIRAEGIRIGADPLGGASVDYWGAIAERHGLQLTVVNPLVDATWRFMTLDTDGKIRMDCSSPNAMASLIANRDKYQIGTGNDADSDRHGVVTPDGGLLNPNHYLAVAIEYLYTNRPDWPGSTAVGKTAVSSSIIDRVVAGLGRKLLEVPVGFKWFVDGLISGTIGFGGEESAGASFLRRDGSDVDDRQGRHHPGAAGVGDSCGDGADTVAALRRTGRKVRCANVCPHRRARRPGAEGAAGEAVAGAGDRDRAGGRGDHRQADHRAGQRRAAGRSEGDDGERVVRGAAVGHRGRLQDLCGVVQGPRASRGGAASRQRRGEYSHSVSSVAEGDCARRQGGVRLTPSRNSRAKSGC